MPKLLPTAPEKGETAVAQCACGSTLTHTRQGLPPNKLHPSTPTAFESSRVKDYRLFYETLAYVAKTMYQKTQCDIITNLTVDPVRLQCFHRDLNVSIHDRICLRSSQ